MSVELRVMQDEETILRYIFRSVSEAAEMVLFLSEFLPGSRYLVQPAPH